MTVPVLELEIASSTHTQHLTPGTVSIYDNLDARSMLSFQLRVPVASSYRPVQGQVVYLANASSTMFGGTVENFTETVFPFSSYNQYNVNCVDFTQMVGKRLVAASFTSSGYDADIITYINTNFFDGEGITTTDYNSTGVTIPEINFNYKSGNEAINDICKRTGRSWFIDPQRRLHYFARDENPAPIEINSTSDNWRTITIRRARDNYRNRQYITDIYDQIVSYPEGFAGDGQTRTFALTYPVYSVPTITLNGTTQSVGILNVDPSSQYQYYWNKKSNLITQQSTDVAVASTDTLLVTYYGLYPIVVKVDDEDEITARAGVENNSGIYERVESRSEIYTATGGESEGSGLLAKYGEFPETITFETDIDGLASGQLIKITLPDNNLNDWYLITAVSGKDVSLATMRYSVTAVSGQDKGGWVSYFRSLTKTNATVGETFTNNTVWSTKILRGNICFCDLGITVTTTIIVGCVVDSGLVDTCLAG